MPKLYSFLLLVSLFSCKKEKEVQACFISDKTEAVVNEIIKFKDCSLYSDNVEWNFGDSNDSGIRNPSHKYNKVGNYQVIQAVYDEKNNKSEVIHDVKVNLMELKKIVVTTPENYSELEIIDLDFGLNFEDVRFRLERINNSFQLVNIDPILIENEYLRTDIYCFGSWYEFNFNYYDVLNFESMSYKFKGTDGIEYELFFSIAD